MVHSLRVQLGAIFWGFLLLVTVSVTATFSALHTQRDDATVINLAGRQRMLTQQMVWLVLTQPDSPELETAVSRFEQTLYVLQVGGTVSDAHNQPVSLPPSTTTEISLQLAAISQTWSLFRQQLHQPDTAVLQPQSSQLLTQLDTLVSTYETQAQAKLTRLRLVQTSFLVMALCLLGYSYLVVQHRLLRPLNNLEKSARFIGKGELNHPIELPPYQDELKQLAQTFDTMRQEIATAHHLLENRVAQRTQEVTAAFEVSQEIVQQLDLNQLLQSITQRAKDLLHGQTTALCLLTENGRFLDLTSSSGESNQSLGLRQSIQRGIALPVIQQRQTVATVGGCTNCGFLHHFPNHPCIAAPLQLAGQPLGALCVVRPPHLPFAPEETRALSLMANAAAIAISNARLVEITRHQTEENAALAERQRLATDLHDNLAQTLAAIKLKVDVTKNLAGNGQSDKAAKQLLEMETAVQIAYSQVRMALTGLSEPTQIQTELMTQLTAVFDEFRQQNNIPLQWEPPIKMVTLPTVAQSQLLHIVREALTNIRRHAQASQVNVQIQQESGRFSICIQDNGKGFDPNQPVSQNHLGLAIMQARANRSGGTVQIQSIPGQGTTITAVFPTTPSHT